MVHCLTLLAKCCLCIAQLVNVEPPPKLRKAVKKIINTNNKNKKKNR